MFMNTYIKFNLNVKMSQLNSVQQINYVACKNIFLFQIRRYRPF